MRAITEKDGNIRRRLAVADAYMRLKFQCRGRVPLKSEYQFKHLCAQLIESCGFVPAGFIRETAQLILERGKIDSGRMS